MNDPRRRPGRWRIYHDRPTAGPERELVYLRDWSYGTGWTYVPIKTFTGPTARTDAYAYVQNVIRANYGKAA